MSEEGVTSFLEPKIVLYCKVCTLPIEYCTYSSSLNSCKTWLKENHPLEFNRLYPSEVVQATEKLGAITLNDTSASTGKAEEEGDDKKHQTRGGKALPKDEQKKLEKEEMKRKKSKVIIKMVERNKRKSVTHIRGMEAFGLDLKQIAKRCASKFACGCSVAKNPAGFDEIVIQGDVVDDLIDFIPQEWPIISEEQIDILEK